ncbi:hypothetical protein [Agromyces sp. SYSU T00266]|uniref:hypothetical protein n=1 Tax=Agromyces zhanjiangensis TaxID=3158562 RepID=UPI003394C99C
MAEGFGPIGIAAFGAVLIAGVALTGCTQATEPETEAPPQVTPSSEAGADVMWEGLDHPFGDEVITAYHGLPDPSDWTPASDGHGSVQVGWLDDGATIAIAVGGGQGCPWAATRLEADQGGDVVRVTVVEERDADASCTFDFGWVTTEFTTPPEVDPGNAVAFSVSSPTTLVSLEPVA